MLFLALGLITVIGIPVFATRGESRRGVYLAGAIVSFALAFIAYSIVSTPIASPTTTAEHAGQELIDANGPPFTLFLAVTGVAFLIGAALWKEKVVAQ